MRVTAALIGYCCLAALVAGMHDVRWSLANDRDRSVPVAVVRGTEYRVVFTPMVTADYQALLVYGRIPRSRERELLLGAADRPPTRPRHRTLVTGAGVGDCTLAELFVGYQPEGPEVMQAAFRCMAGRECSVALQMDETAPWIDRLKPRLLVACRGDLMERRGIMRVALLPVLFLAAAMLGISLYPRRTEGAD